MIWKEGLKKFGIWAAASKRRKPESYLEKMIVPSLPVCLQTASELNTHDCMCARPQLLLLFYFNVDSAVIINYDYSFIQPQKLWQNNEWRTDDFILKSFDVSIAKIN